MSDAPEQGSSRVGDAVAKALGDKAFFDKLMTRIIANADLYTAPFNMLPKWVSNLTGGSTLSAPWISSHVLPFMVASAVIATVAWNRTDKEASNEMKTRRFANLQLVLTGVSVSYALFTFGKLQYAIRGAADRAVITTAALFESMLNPEGVVNETSTQVIQGRLLRRLPVSVRDRLASGVRSSAASGAAAAALPSDVGTL